MRLRQAHAILEAATALEAAGLGFELWPYHHDFPGNATRDARDRISGGAEFSDPDMGDRDARIYNIDLRPGPDDDHIEAVLTLGLGPDPEPLLHTEWSVALDTREDERFQGLVGAQLAEQIAAAVREHEKPYRAAYEERARRKRT